MMTQTKSSVTDSPSAINPSCFGTLGERAQYAQQTATRLEGVVDRLIGAEPQSIEKDSEGIVGGLFGDAYLHCATICKSSERINAALDRLEKFLP